MNHLKARDVGEVSVNDGDAIHAVSTQQIQRIGSVTPHNSEGAAERVVAVNHVITQAGIQIAHLGGAQGVGAGATDQALKADQIVTKGAGHSGRHDEFVANGTAHQHHRCRNSAADGRCAADHQVFNTSDGQVVAAKVVRICAIERDRVRTCVSRIGAIHHHGRGGADDIQIAAFAARHIGHARARHQGVVTGCADEALDAAHVGAHCATNRLCQHHLVGTAGAHNADKASGVGHGTGDAHGAGNANLLDARHGQMGQVDAGDTAGDADGIGTGCVVDGDSAAVVGDDVKVIASTASHGLTVAAIQGVVSSAAKQRVIADTANQHRGRVAGHHFVAAVGAADAAVGATADDVEAQRVGHQGQIVICLSARDGQQSGAIIHNIHAVRIVAGLATVVSSEVGRGENVGCRTCTGEGFHPDSAADRDASQIDIATACTHQLCFVPRAVGAIHIGIEVDRAVGVVVTARIITGGNGSAIIGTDLHNVVGAIGHLGIGLTVGCVAVVVPVVAGSVNPVAGVLVTQLPVVIPPRPDINPVVIALVLNVTGIDSS